MLNCSNIVIVRFDFLFEAHFNVKCHVRMMMSWIALYSGYKYDSYRVHWVRRF